MEWTPSPKKSPVTIIILPTQNIVQRTRPVYVLEGLYVCAKGTFTREATGSATGARHAAARLAARHSVYMVGSCRARLLHKKAAFTRDATGSATAAWQPRRKIETLEYNRSVYTATCCSQQTRDCCEPGRHFKFELIIAARHRLSRAVPHNPHVCWLWDSQLGRRHPG